MKSSWTKMQHQLISIVKRVTLCLLAIHWIKTCMELSFISRKESFWHFFFQNSNFWKIFFNCFQTSSFRSSCPTHYKKDVEQPFEANTWEGGDYDKLALKEDKRLQEQFFWTKVQNLWNYYVEQQEEMLDPDEFKLRKEQGKLIFLKSQILFKKSNM